MVRGWGLCPLHPFGSNEVAPEGTSGGCLLLWAPYPDLPLWHGAVPSVTWDCCWWQPQGSGGWLSMSQPWAGGSLPFPLDEGPAMLQDGCPEAARWPTPAGTQGAAGGLHSPHPIQARVGNMGWWYLMPT